MEAAPRLSLSLIRRAFDPPARPAQLAALAVELRRQSTWISVCRLASQQRPDWLLARLRDDDPLLELVAAAGDPEADRRAGKATAALAYMLCGEIDERDALCDAAGLTGEPAPATLADLDQRVQPLLADLIAELRGPRRAMHGVAISTLADVEGRCDSAAATAAVVSGRQPGVRADLASRLFHRPDPDLAAAAEHVERLLDVDDLTVLINVSRTDSRTPRGDAPQAAVFAAAVSALRQYRPIPSLIVVGRIANGQIVVPQRPPWEAVAAELASENSRGAQIVVPAATDSSLPATVVATPRALRQLLARPTRRRSRRRFAASIAVIAVLGISALLAVNTNRPRDADAVARRATALLSADPAGAAVLAAQALAERRGEQTIRAALTITARSPLTEASGRDRGRLLAVAIRGATVTTVTTAGRATRWRLRRGSVQPYDAVELPRRLDLVALSRGGRWLLIHPQGGRDVDRLLIDLTGERPSRVVVGTDREDPLIEVSDADPPVIATAGEKIGMSLGATERSPRIQERVTAIGFSRTGRHLAVGTASGRTRVFAQSKSGWKPATPWRLENPRAAISSIDVDDDLRTVAVGEGPLATRRVRWRSVSGPKKPLVRRLVTSLLSGQTTALNVDTDSVELFDNAAAGDSGSALTLPRSDDAPTVVAVATDPATRRAVVAETRGAFAVLDLRRVHPLEQPAVTGSVAIRLGQVRALLRPDARLVRWDTQSGMRIPTGPQPPSARPIVAATSTTGQFAVYGTHAGRVEVRDLDNNQVTAQLRNGAHRHWGAVAVSADGSTVAAVDTGTSAASVWVDAVGEHPRAVFTSAAATSPADGPLTPVAISDAGRYLMYGLEGDYRLRDLSTRRERRIVPQAFGRVIRASFFGDRLFVAGEKSIGTAAPPAWQLDVRPTPETPDAVPFRDGIVAVTSPAGIQGIPRRGAPIDLPSGFGNDHRVPNSIAIDTRRELYAAHGATAPLILMRTPTSSLSRLCALAGGRRPTSGGCGPAARLPRPHGPRARPPYDPVQTLSPDGLGPVVIGRRLPRNLTFRTAYRFGDCALRTLRGVAASVVTYRGRVESIGIYPTGYVSDESPFSADQDVLTSLGASAGSPRDARAIYGPPDGGKRGRTWWRLLNSAGRPRVLSVSRDATTAPSIVMRLTGPRCGNPA